MGLDQQIRDFAASLLLRYFRPGGFVALNVPRLDHRRDLDLMKGHWSISQPVRRLLSYLVAHPHETQSLLTAQTRIEDAVVRGRIDARKTWTYRLQSGLPTAVVASEPVRSFDTGANLVLAWVIKEAAAYVARLGMWQAPESPYFTMIEQVQHDLRSVHRIEALREPLRSASLGRRPGAGAVRMAARARPVVYRLASEAYLLLQGIEAGDRTAIDTVIRTALVGPLEQWRQFELAVGLALGEALVDAGVRPFNLHLLGGNSSAPIITVGKFSIYWQQQTSFYSIPTPEPSELVVRNILDSFGIASGADRPDFVVVDRDLEAVVSVVEVKYLTGDTALGRFREAVGQVVRYARGYATPAEMGTLIGRSLIALSSGAPERMKTAGQVPTSVDFQGMSGPVLKNWAKLLA